MFINFACKRSVANCSAKKNPYVAIAVLSILPQLLNHLDGSLYQTLRIHAAFM